jgi:hypothetical protein
MSHIIKHAKGQTIFDITDEKDLQGFRIHFTSGESLQFYPNAHGNFRKGYSIEMIATPYDKDGKVKQSTTIEEDV